MMELTLEQRIARLEAIDAIKRLKAEYCAFCDAQYDPDGIAAQFLPDGVWDGGSVFGRHVGRDAIRTFFAGVSGNIVFAAHLVMNPIIDVHDADRATGRWRLLMPCTVQETGATQARWLLTGYVEDYARVDGAWLFRSMTVNVDFYEPHRTGWAES